MKRRVVVTGIGAVCPLGNSVKQVWPRLVAGESGIGPITIFNPEGFPTRIAGEVKNFDYPHWIKHDPALQESCRSTFFALQASQEAFRDSHLKAFNIDPERFGIYFGAGDSGIDFDPFVKSLADSFQESQPELVAKDKYMECANRYMSPRRELEHQPFMTVTHLARRFDIRGPVSNCLTACAASSQAMGEAYQWILRGDADIVLSGGSNSMVYPLGVAGFSLLTALSTQNDSPQTSSRPFDKNRDGFVLSEGAGALILEELSHALKRKARIYGEIVGYGSTADAYRLTDMDPEGSGAAKAIQIAMEKAGLEPHDIDYINAHGTSTDVNDRIETRAIKKVMGHTAYQIPVSSIKSMLGHMIAAAGAIEAITCFLAMRDSVIPPTINYTEQDPDCDLDYVPNQARQAEVNVALSNSFGFGGQNICLALRRFKHES